MSIKQCERCEGDVEKEEVMLGSDSSEQKLLSLYRCNQCGRLEYGIPDLTAA